jgi:ParB/RepB/Spo0J family partition protein
MKVENISIDRIIVPFEHESMRSYVTREKLDSLKESIKKHGVLQPLIVEEHEDCYHLVAGWRRLQAAKELDLQTVPCYVVQASKNDVDVMRLHENIEREEMNPIDEARYFLYLINKYNLTYDKLSQMTGYSTSYISERISVLKEDPKVADALLTNRINFSVARAIVREKDKSIRTQLLMYALEAGANAQKIEQWRRELVQVAQARGVYTGTTVIAPPITAVSSKEETAVETSQKEVYMNTSFCESCTREVPRENMRVLSVCDDCYKEIRKVLEGG